MKKVNFLKEFFENRFDNVYELSRTFRIRRDLRSQEMLNSAITGASAAKVLFSRFSPPLIGHAPTPTHLHACTCHTISH